jgi:hypothetical protein
MEYNRKMILWLLLSISFSFAQDSAIEEYCFSSAAKMQQVSQKLKFILVPVDKVLEDNNCFTVNTPAHRRELIQNYVRRLDSNVSIGFSSAEVRRNPCRLRVEKIKNKVMNTVSGGLSTRLSGTAGIDESNGQSKEVTQIQTLNEFELTVNQDSVKGECRFINPTRYEITITVAKEAVPLIPPVPPGTIVNVPDSQLGKIQETSKLQTTVQLNSGERMEIGSVVKNLKADGNNVDINSGASLSRASGHSHEKIYLSID